ncbi:hypothetical protein COOONC_02532 [Cooperia oncophora]
MSVLSDVTGSSDGSVRIWEWGVGQPVFTARVAGQHAKVSKVSFSCNGDKFAAVDVDGMLGLWQATPSTEHSKPFFVSGRLLIPTFFKGFFAVHVGRISETCSFFLFV